MVTFLDNSLLFVKWWQTDCYIVKQFLVEMRYRCTFLGITKHGLIKQDNKENKILIYLTTSPQLLKCTSHISVAGYCENFTRIFTIDKNDVVVLIDKFSSS